MAGLSYSVGVGIIAKGLEIIKEVVPGSALWRSSRTRVTCVIAIRNVQIAAVPLGLELQLLDARSPNEFDGVFAAIAKERVGALLVAAGGMFFQQRARLADLAATNRLPSIFGIRENVEAGGLICQGHDLPQSRRAGAYLDKILKGAKPADLPVEQPTKVELVITSRPRRRSGSPFRSRSSPAPTR